MFSFDVELLLQTYGAVEISVHEFSKLEYYTVFFFFLLHACQVGARWGYYQFFRIDLLEKEGYLLPEEDAITLCFYVRPLT